MSLLGHTPVVHLSTFSIVARSAREGEFGVASATAAPCVGAMLPYAAEKVGAIATQAWVNVNLGHHGIRLMRSGLSARAALGALLSEDEGRERRQVIGIGRDSVFGFTGSECTDAKGHLIGKDYAVAGNILAHEDVLEAMSSTFSDAKGDLAERMLRSLEAGQRAGGDSRGKLSAVLLVASARPRLWHNLRVDMHKSPVEELRRVYDAARVMQEELGNDDDGEVLKIRRFDD
jgi:uncharacterized Ntn-hydrolase superfamily protein